LIALDTNVLIRYLVDDDPKQARAATSLVERALQRGESIFISQIVLCELVWVLSYAYDFHRKEIARLIGDLRRAAQVQIEDPDQVARSLERYTASGGDFADYLIAERAMARGCSAVATFDRALHKDSRFVAVS